MAEKQIYVKGMRVFPPHEKAPDFVKGTLLITPNVLDKFCEENAEYMTEYKGEKQLKCQILEGDTGLYFTVDTWKKDSSQSSQKDTEFDKPKEMEAPEDSSELPF